VANGPAAEDMQSPLDQNSSMRHTQQTTGNGDAVEEETTVSRSTLVPSTQSTTTRSMSETIAPR
jgi:hypothetical protein